MGKNKNKNKNNDDKMILKNPDDLQEYAHVLRALGNKRFEVYCFDGKKRLAHVRGSLRKTMVKVDNIVLVSLRDFQDNKCDILHIYNPKDVEYLKNKNEITISKNENEDVFEFDYKDEDEDEINIDEI
jgi:translation initiation factor 1A